MDHRPDSINSTLIASMNKLGIGSQTVIKQELVTIKAKYGENFIKFQLTDSSGIEAFHQQVFKRLELELGKYLIKYQDDKNEWILVERDEDLKDYFSTSKSLGKTTLLMLIEPKCEP